MGKDLVATMGYFVNTIGVNESIIRGYVQKQELEERQAEQLGFDY
jgi:hypothetical protein